MYLYYCLYLFFNYLKLYIGCFFYFLTEKSRPEALPALPPTPRVWEI